MKQLLLIRHAKSDWDDPSLSDFDRPLNPRGKRDAPVMATRLKDKKIKIDAFVSSTAKRAKKTATIFAEEYNAKKKNIILLDELYAAEANVFYDVIKNIDDAFDSIAIFAHNPGITDFANELADVRIDNIPTCGVFAVKVATSHWADFKDAKKEFWFFDQPKEVSA
ncbi:MAG: histidine phosphatase family protein [Bacteroidota bacterium]